jgi:DNA/RNA endonuclease YhcR with UshA esterase domain
MLALATCLIWLPSAVAAYQDNPITPEEAAKKVNQEVTLQMEVKSASVSKGVCFLNSSENFKDVKNFTIFIGKDALAKFSEAKIADPASYFRGKRVQVKGKVTLYHDRPEITLTGPEAIRLVENE